MPHPTPVNAVDATGKVLKSFEKQTAAAHHYGIMQSKVSYSLQTGAPTSAGVWFRYAERENVPLRMKLSRANIPVKVGFRRFRSIGEAAREMRVAYDTMWRHVHGVPRHRASRVKLAQAKVELEAVA